MSPDLRPSGIAAGCAALLSLLVGLIAGVGLAALVARALLGGLAFGALVYGMLYAARRFLPGSLPGAAPRAAADSQAAVEQGRLLNIVLPGDEAQDYAAPAETKAAQEGGEPVFEPRTKGSGSTHADDDGEELENLLGADASEPAALPPERGEAEGNVFENLDVLPDLDGFAGSFSTAEADAPESEEDGGESPVARYKAEDKRGDFDPATVAQAVRTILKREKKG